MQSDGNFKGVRVKLLILCGFIFFCLKVNNSASMTVSVHEVTKALASTVKVEVPTKEKLTGSANFSVWQSYIGQTYFASCGLQWVLGFFFPEQSSLQFQVGDFRAYVLEQINARFDAKWQDV